ncbi:MAG: glycosyl hydrolase 53 family protein [Rhizomicrobium sp.]
MKRLLLALLLAAVPASSGAARDLYFGGDLSFANEMDDCGAVYRDHGVQKDVYRIFKDHGANLVRIRIWNNADWTKYSNLADVERSIRRAKAAGMRVLLDFHYSDTWADGDHQIAPKAWAALADSAKQADALYRYTFDTLATLDRDGLMPDLVQVGNEINRELLGAADWAIDRPIDWTRNALLINAGIKAVRDAGAHSAIKPKIMLHIAQPENAEPWFLAATKAGITDYDIIGLSYYPKWSKYNVAGLGIEIYRLRHIYPHAEVMVVETGYPWTLQWKDDLANVLGADSVIPGMRPTREDQRKYLLDLRDAVLKSGGDGIVYWAPDWVSTGCMTQWGRGSSWENAALFDFDGELLPGIDFLDPPGAAH